jgi:hypothetical protein
MSDPAMSHPSADFERYDFGADVPGVGWVNALGLFGTEDPKITFIGAHRHVSTPLEPLSI